MLVQHSSNVCHPNHARPRVDQDGTGKIRTELQWILCNCLVPTIQLEIPKGIPPQTCTCKLRVLPKSRIKLQETLCHGIVPTLQLQNSQQRSSPVVHFIAHDTPMIHQHLEGGQTQRTNEHLELCNEGSSKVPPSELDKIGKIIELSNSSSRFSKLAKMRNITKSRTVQGIFLLATYTWQVPDE